MSRRRKNVPTDHPCRHNYGRRTKRKARHRLPAELLASLGRLLEAPDHSLCGTPRQEYLSNVPPLDKVRRLRDVDCIATSRAFLRSWKTAVGTGSQLQVKLRHKRLRDPAATLQRLQTAFKRCPLSHFSTYTATPRR